MLSRMSRLKWSWWMAGVWAMGLLLWGQPIFAQGPEWVWQNPPPTGNDLYGVWGSSGTDPGSLDVYAVGDRGTILHYDGSSWSNMSSGTTIPLRGVWGSSGTDPGPPDVFAVGSTDYPDYEGILLHYDGSSWSRILGDPGHGLYAIWGSSGADPDPPDIFAVGYAGTILHYDGSTWSSMSTGTKFHPTLLGVWGSSGADPGSSDVFALGEQTILHYDGSGWSPMATVFAWLYAVWGSSGTDPGPLDVYAVGWDFYEDSIPHDDGSTAPSMNRGTGYYVRGAIQHYDGTWWSSMDSGTSYWLRGVWGTSNRNVFAVGQNGTIMHYDGRRWSSMNSGVTADLTASWGIPDRDVFAVGTGGAILHHTPVPRLTIRKDALPVGRVPYQGAITYTVVLGNDGTGGATGAVLTDTLPAEVAFARWLERPDDARVESDEITWGGAVQAGEAITLSFVVDHVGSYGDVVTNTAVYSHASGGGSDHATFTVEPAPILLLPLIVNAFSP